MKTRKRPIPTDDVERRIIADVDRFGWHVILVADDSEGTDEGFDFAYSVGLFEGFKHPELLVIGLPKQVAHEVLNLLGERVKKGERFANGDVVEDVIDGYAVTFVEVEQGHYADYVGCGVWFYTGSGFPLLQVVWPDKKKRYPWDKDASEGFCEAQPLLGRR